MTITAASHLVREQQVRADFLDEIYRRSGRTNGLYTGLWEQFCDECLSNFLGRLAEDLGDKMRAEWAANETLTLGCEE